MAGLKTLSAFCFSLMLISIIILLALQFSGCGSSSSTETTTTTSTTTTSAPTTTSTSTTTTTLTSDQTTTTTTTTSTTTITGPGSFQALTMATSDIDYILPLGSLNPYAHTLPTDHIYLLYKDVNSTYDVYFPGSGEVRSVQYASDYSVTVKYSSTFTYVLGHLSSIEAVYAPYIGQSNISGLTATAGQKVGTTGKNSNGVVAMDLGVIDTDVTRYFVNSSNYISNTINCGSPISYYVEPLKTQMYNLVTRVGTTEKDGKIDFDQAGKLIGNWFSTAITPAAGDTKSNSMAYGNGQIAFVRNNTNATQEMISIGGSITGEGVAVGAYAVSYEATPFENVDQSSGIVTYVLYDRYDPTSSQGYLIVRYNTNDTISVEASSSNISDFSSAVTTYTR